jgi:hypothetical protein
VDDAQIVQELGSLIVRLTGSNPASVHLSSHVADDSLQLTVRFDPVPDHFEFLPFLKTIEPITRMNYSNRFGEKCWSVSGRYADRKVGVAYHVEIVRD